MRVLFLSQYFPPEIGATQSRAREMARGLVRAGHEVTVVTEVPNHPTGVIPPSYRGRAFVSERMDGFEVERVWVKTTPEKTSRSRLAFYGSYMAMAVLAGIFRARGPFDLVFATSPPLFTGAAALALRALRRAPLVFEVRDLWPESALQLGEMRPGRALRAAQWLERRCYAAAAHVVAVTEGIRSDLLARGLDPAVVTTISNGANVEVFRPLERDLGRRERLGLRSDDFVVIYSGLHGLAHGLRTILEAARILRDEKDVVFLLVGDGPRKADLVREVEGAGLTNVRFHDAVPEEELAEWIAAADVGLDVRKQTGITHGTLPVKMFAYMACGRPVLMALEGEAEALVRRADAGVVVPPEDPGALAAAVREMKVDPAGRKRWGENGRAYVTETHSREALAAELVTVLEGVVGEPGGASPEGREGR